MRPVWDSDDPKLFFYDVAFTPVQEFILYVGREPGQDRTRLQTLHEYNVKSSETKLLASLNRPIHVPRMSVDGRHIVFLSPKSEAAEREYSGIWTVDLEDGDVRQVPFGTSVS